jgi:outer membrane protein OmpA-like peptidoglycan-associated protein
LCPGLTIVTAISQSTGDYESIKTIESVTADEIRLKYSSEMPFADWLTGESGIKKTLVHRRVRQKDLQSSTSYQQIFLGDGDELIPETTAIGVSAAVLKALKTRGESEFAISAIYPGSRLTGDRNVSPNAYDFLQLFSIKRTGSAPVMVPVLLNNTTVELPTIQAVGESGGVGGDQNEFFILDDERNPLVLKFRLGIGGVPPLTKEELQEECEPIKKSGRPLESSLAMGINCAMPKGGDRDTLRVVKIDTRCTTAPQTPPTGSGSGGGQAPAGSGVAQLEQQLTEKRRAEVYSIYFSFNSDAIREESEPTLKDIAAVLTRHPDWTLSVEGHTDGIGSDQKNLDLSRRRAAAVKDALTKRYRIPANRLTTEGFGKSRPKDTNDTIEGRSRNRRVELARLS